jgi:cytochrome b subunit of formate dehydrogenase/NAD-dependent dihydropyrimidine dehydrogenase PreA subunit
MRQVFPLRTDALDQILDRVHPPVARLRIISNGLAHNHTLKTEDDISGTRACLSCGNCVDGCPVVAGKPEGTMFVRTSMLLENVVGEECRRCYRCVAACPQVSPPLKEYVRGFRRVERTAHWDLLASYLVLMLTGILINHWGSELPADLRAAFGLLHRIFAVGLLAAPLLFLIFDGRHFLMALRRGLNWSRRDLGWFSDAWQWLRTMGGAGRLTRGAFNPGQRFWYLYVPIAIAVFGITGGIKWVGPDLAGESTVATATVVHVGLALMTDVLLVLHIYLKLVWPVARDAVRGYRQHFETRRRRSRPAELRVG